MDNSKTPILPNQRVSLKTKQSNAWTKQMADYIVSLAYACNNKQRTKEFLDMANGVVSKDMYNYVLQTYGVVADDSNQNLLDDLRDIDLLQPIKDKYLGEFTNAYSNYQVYTDDPNTIISRNKDFGAKLMEVMQQQLINELNKTMNTGQDSQPMPDINKMLQDFIYKWDDERTSKAQKRLNLLNNIIDAKLKYNQLYYYWWATEECYTFRRVFRDSIIFEVVSPLEYYRIPGDGYYVEDDEAGVRIHNRTLYSILDLYGDYLKKEDLNYLTSFSNGIVDEDTKMGILKARALEFGMSENDFIQNESSYRSHVATNSVLANPDKIPMVHYVFTTEVKVGYLKYHNEVGEVIERLVDETYILNPSNGDIEIKWDWLQQKYQGEIIGYCGTHNNIEAVYTKVRPIDVQRELFTDLNVTKSPYNGLSYIHKDSQPKPIPYRINPYVALYRIYHYQVEKAINKWKNILVLPESILTETSEFSLDQRLAKLNGDALLIFDDSKASQQALNAIKEIATTATFNYVSTLINLMASIKQDAWENCNMNPTRMGSQKAYQGKSVTEESLQQSEISSSWALEMFNLFRSKDYLSNYDHSKVAWSEGKVGSYIDESTSESHFVEVDPLDHLGTNIGINVGNSRLLDEKLKAMKQFAFNLSQNGDVEIGMEAILNDNLQVLKRQVLTANDAKKAYEQQLSDSKNQAAIQAQQIAQQTKQMELEATNQVETLKSHTAIEKAYIDQETQLLVWEQRLKVDTNGNGFIDEGEAYGTAIESAKNEAAKLQMKREELALKRKQVLHNMSQQTKQ